ncbi:MAG TPA: ABC transporter ATP-binding protein [Thermoanaerobaculia bacterium]|nr:ABC transporter ATP-binding protein [Thermoanaerobaculia bacterium]
MKVSLENVSYAYSEAPVLGGDAGNTGDTGDQGISLDLREGETTVVIGPSGSGKSTLLRLLAGLLHPRTGAVRFDGRDMVGVPTEKRDVGVVFQSYALFPHLTVRQNIAFGLTTARYRRQGHTPAEVDRRVAETAALLALEALLDRRPTELSGGEQQRVAVARALAPRPALLLFDEPLSALDARLRRTVRADLSRLLASLGTTVLYVTHDQEEALLLADHLVVLNRGQIVQQGPPLDLYRRPADPFVATFLGEANLLPVSRQGGRFVTALGTLPATLHVPEGKPLLLVRPEDLVVDPNGVRAGVAESRGLGPYDRVVLRLPGGPDLLAHLPPGAAPEAGAILGIALRPGAGHLL